jgi:hypothetical protein
MASNAQITASLMEELGKTAPALRRKISSRVGDVTLELLQQNEGRFSSLVRTQTISVTAGTKEYRIRSDYNTARKTMYEVDVNNDYVARVRIVSKAEMFNRYAEDAHTDENMAYIQFFERGPNDDSTANRGYYLVLGEEPVADVSYLFEYYRTPTTSDTDIIRKESIIKHGVRAAMPREFESAQMEATVYLRMLRGFREKPERFVTDTIMTPSKRIGDHNKRMYGISRGD